MDKQHIVDTLFTGLARSEEQLFPDAVILSNFPRSLQLDSYSCGAKSTYVILKYFGKRCTAESVERELGTDEDGTSPTNIKRVMKMHGLSIKVNTNMTIRDLKKAIDAGSPVLVSLYEGEHYSAVYGYGGKHVFIMNPSLGEVGSIKCAVSKVEFRQIFDNWGIVVSSS